jgi:iron complex outermembrane recepter protein
MRQLIGIVLFIHAFLIVEAQDCRFVLSGHIEDADTKEKLSGATVVIRELNVSFVTDANGDFRYPNICAGIYNVQVSHIGCQDVVKTIQVSKNHHLDVLMPHLRYNLQEVVVEAPKHIHDNSFMRQLDEHHLETSRAGSIAEALANINGVGLLQTGTTISKPVIHGLHSNRVLTINNGIRQEGQQWGNEHAPEVDTYVADKVAVVKGVGALRYGSDAIGGAVIIDPRPLRTLPGYNAEINTAFSTNNRQYVASAIFEHQPVRLSAFTYRVQGTFKKAANVRTPEYRLNNTGLSEQNYSLAGIWKKEHYNLQAYYSEFASQIGIFPGSHIGNLTDLINIIPQSKPNDVFLGENTYNLKRPRQEVLHRLFKMKAVYNKNQHKFSFTFGGQYNHRDEFDIVRSSTNQRPQVSLAIITTSQELVYEHPEFRNIKGSAGLSFMQQDNSYSGRYLIPNYQSNTYGGFWLEKWSKGNWTVEAGVRADDKRINTQRMKFNGTRSDHSFHFSTMGTSLNTAYRLNKYLEANIGISMTSRAPHVNELLVDGVHEGTGTYEQGDISLKSEKSSEISGGFSFNTEKKQFSAEVFFYHNRIRDFIYQQPEPDRPVLTIVGAFPLIRYKQTNARLNGIDASVNYLLTSQLQLTSRLSLLRALNRATNDWMILMPADRWRNELVFNFEDGDKRRNSYVSAELVSTFRPRVPSDANGKQDYKEPPGPYTLVNVSASSAFNLFATSATVSVSVRNLLDVVYRDYLNSFRYYTDEMGRNITLMLKVPIEKF